jgi:hypothetical protein
MAKPKIDHQFWFDYSERIVKSATESGDAAASKLQSLALWLWGVYTGGAAIGFALASKRLSPEATLLIALGSVCIISVYWAAVWVQIPIVAEFDPRSPDEIIELYSAAVYTKKKRLKLTLALSAFAAVYVSFALIMAAVSKGTLPPFGEFQATISTNGFPPRVAVTGNIGSAKQVLVTLSDTREHFSSGAAMNGITLIPFRDGLIQTALPVADKSLTNHVFVRLEWDDSSGTTFCVTKLASAK